MEMALKTLNDLGIWNILSFLLALSAWIAGVIFLVLPHRRVRDLNFSFYVADAPGKKFPTRLYVFVRNLTKGSITLSSPYMKLKQRSIANELADGNSSTGEFELKFPGEDAHFSEGLTLLRPGDEIETFLPLNPKEDLKVLVAQSSRSLGRFYCSVTILSGKPSVRHLRLPIVNVQNRTQKSRSEQQGGDQV